MVVLYWMMLCIDSVLKAPSPRLKLGTLKLHIYLKKLSHPDFMTNGPESPYTQFRPAVLHWYLNMFIYLITITVKYESSITATRLYA